MRKSQRNKRRADALRLHAKARRYVATTPRGRTRPSRPPVSRSVSEQVGPVATFSMSQVGSTDGDWLLEDLAVVCTAFSHCATPEKQ